MKVELSIHASKLKNVAGLGKGTSDPYAVVTALATLTDQTPQVLGKTEVIKNTLSPNWVKTFTLDYDLGTPLKVAIQIYDEVRKGDNISMGSATFEVGEILGARGNVKAKKIKKGGTVFAHVSKAKGSGLLRLKMKGINLKNTEGFMRKSDPFFEICRRLDSAGGLTWKNVYRSNAVENSLSPTWNDATVELSTLCEGDLDKPIQIQVYDYESSGKHVPMGQFETTVNGLVQASSGGAENMAKAFTLKRKGHETGKILVLRAEVAGVEEVTQKMAAAAIAPTPSAPVYTPSPVAPVFAAKAASTFVPSADKPTFVDYISGGCELNVCVAIDFTGSNGDPRDPNTLHYISRDGRKNDYEKAISAILKVLAQYDSNQEFPVLGFGAKYGGIVRHCFQCGPPEAKGVDGVLDAYHAVFKSGLVMSGPTVFTEVIQTAAARAMSAQEAAQQMGEQAYTILLILTDGAVSDVQATAAVLDQVSTAPLSIVIVGVGNADFSSMRFLDDASKPGKRDLIQFVEFNKHSRNSVELTSETLEEIPDQLVAYFTTNGIQPRPSIQRNDSEIVVEPEEEEIDLSLSFRDDNEIVVSSGGNAFHDDFRDGFVG